MASVGVMLVAGIAAIASTKLPHGVGPWDIREALSPSGLTVGSPSNAIPAQESLARFPDGTTVELVGLSREFQGPPSVDGSLTDRAWRPDGSPYDGNGPNMTRAAWHQNRGEAVGQRYIAFDIRSPKPELDIYGYIPESLPTAAKEPENHGADLPTTVHVWKDGTLLYRATLVVANQRADKYAFGIAIGPWTRAATLTTSPGTPQDKVLGSGQWGTLHMIPPAPENEWGKRTLPHVTLKIETKEPRKFSYRIKVFNSKGAQVNRPRTGRGDVVHVPISYSVARGSTVDIGRIEIETCPYTYAEFRNVHYNPDPVKWGESYWGEEGNKAIVHGGNAAIVGIIKPVPKNGSWESASLYAPDGQRWREYPNQNFVAARFSGGTWEAGTPYAVLVKLSADHVAAGKRATIEVSASDSDAERGEAVLPKLGSQFGEELNQVPFVLSKPAKYLHVGVSYTSVAWQEAGRFSPPSEPLYILDAKDKAAMKRGVNVGGLVYQVMLWGDGHMSLFYHDRAGKGISKDSGIVWNPSAEKRLVACMKDGSRRVMEQNAAGSGTGGSYSAYLFYPNAKDEHWITSHRTKLRLQDIESFAVETREFGQAEWLTAKLPPTQ